MHLGNSFNFPSEEKTMAVFQPPDSRGFFMLPQAPEGAGYFVYGDVNDIPGTGPQGQYAHPNLLTVIFHIEREWQAMCDRKFGIGYISIAGGGIFLPHRTHRTGADTDCQPVRKDRLTGQHPDARTRIVHTTTSLPRSS